MVILCEEAGWTNSLFFLAFFLIFIEYSQMDGNYEVIHHTEFIDQLVKTGKITLNKSLKDL
jgi:Fe-S oxidoreductase